MPISDGGLQLARTIITPRDPGTGSRTLLQSALLGVTKLSVRLPLFAT